MASKYNSNKQLSEAGSPPLLRPIERVYGDPTALQKSQALDMQKSSTGSDSLGHNKAGCVNNDSDANAIVAVKRLSSGLVIFLRRA